MQSGLVSLITPCYNTGAIIHRLLDSILGQDYPQIEMFVVDDGSTDNTREVVLSYIPRFLEKGYQLDYSYQPNSGQATAVNSVLGNVHGEFLAWPDSDDYYADGGSITSFVNQFRKLDESYGLVRCYPVIVDEGNLAPIPDGVCHSFDSVQFENCLFARRGFVWPPVSYMARMSSFRDVNPSMQIYTAYRIPQNWQMLLPLLYSYKCYTLAESVSCVVYRTASYSHGTYNTYEQRLTYFTNFEEILFNTLDRITGMGQEEREAYKRKVHQQYQRERLLLAINCNRMDDAMECLKQLKNAKVRLDTKAWLKIQQLRYPTIYSGLKKIWSLVK